MKPQSHHLFPGKTFITTALDALEFKAAMTSEMRSRYLMRAAMAGIIVGVMYDAYLSVIAAFDAVPVGGSTLKPIGKIFGALTFSPALVFIYWSKSELLTSNMMIVSIGKYYRRITATSAGRILFWCLVGNALGGLFVALALNYSTMISPQVLGIMTETVDHKLEYVHEGLSGWADLFVRALYCNFMINLAMLLIYNGYIKEDLLKALIMMIAVFVFAFTGMEHSVANTVLFEIYAFQGQLDIAAAAANVLICLLGNFVGGGFLIGLYYAYVNDDARYLREHPEELDQAPGLQS
ncbi:MAG: formate/nitrite transporter family protein [Candidatus Nanopelagicales bacterium]